MRMAVLGDRASGRVLEHAGGRGRTRVTDRGAGAGDAGDLGDRGAAQLDLLEPVLAQAAHAVAHRDLGDRVGGGALDRQAADLVVDGHDLVEADAALVARAAAARAADGLVGLEVGDGREAVGAQDVGGEDRAALAVRAQRAGQALGDDAVDRAGHEERLDAHLDQAA